MASICYEEEELELLRRLDLFSLALKNTMGHETSGPQQQQQHQNLDRLFDQLEQAFSGMPTKVKATVWYSKLRIKLEKKISEYRSIQKKTFADADEEKSPFDKNSKESVEVKVMPKISNPDIEKSQQPQPLIKSKLHLTAVKFTPRFSPLLPSFLVEGIGRNPSALAAAAASFISHSSNSSYIGTDTITETTPNPNQSQPTEHFHHHFHHHFLHHNSPFSSFEWPAAPTTHTLPAIPFFSSSSTFSQRVVVAPHFLRFQILSLIALFPPVTNPTGIADLNNLFASVAFTARWIFDYLDDDLFQTAVFQGFFSRMPALLQELFINPLPPPIIITSSSSSFSSFSQVKPRKPYEPKLVNLIAFLHRFLLSLIMRTRAIARKKEEENKGRGKLPLPIRYCAFCKLQTSHNIVDCPLRFEALCHRCFMTGHNTRQCRNPSLLPPAWLNSGQIKFEKEVGEGEADTFLFLHPK